MCQRSRRAIWPFTSDPAPKLLTSRPWHANRLTANAQPHSTHSRRSNCLIIRLGCWPPAASIRSIHGVNTQPRRKADGRKLFFLSKNEDNTGVFFFCPFESDLLKWLKLKEVVHVSDCQFRHNGHVTWASGYTRSHTSAGTNTLNSVLL